MRIYTNVYVNKYGIYKAHLTFKDLYDFVEKKTCLR